MSRPHPDQQLDLHDTAPPYGTDLNHDNPPPAERRGDRRTRVTKARPDTDYDDGYSDERPLPPPPAYGETSRRGGQRLRGERERGNRDHNRDLDRDRDRDHDRRPEASSWSGSKPGSFIRTGIKSVREALNSIETQSQGHGDSRGRDPNRHQPHPHSANGFDTRTMETQEDAHLKNIEDLQIQLTSANSHIEDLKKKLRANEEAGALLKRRNNAMQSSRDAQEELLGRQEEDLSISGTFEDLFHQVKAWTGKFCSTANTQMIVTGVHKDHLAQIQRVLPALTDVGDLPEFLPLGALRRRRQFVRGWLGLVLAETLIRSLPGPLHPTSVGRDYWLPLNVDDGLRELETALLNSREAITLTAFHQWRTITMSLLGKVYPQTRWSQDTMNTIEDKADFALSVIRPLASHPDDGELRQKLLINIFIPAVEFSQFLRRQRACWSVRFPSLTPANALPRSEPVANLFDRTTMEDRDSLAEDDLEDASTDHCLNLKFDTIIRSLIQQILALVSLDSISLPLATELVKCLELAKEGHFPLEILDQLLSKASSFYENWIIVVDGIDECHPNEQGRLYQFLSRRVQAVPSSHKIKILLSGRETTQIHINHAFESVSRLITGSNHTSEDIKVYAEDVLQAKLPSMLLVVEETAIINEIVDAIASKEQGM
ncbi:hypothetical protein QQX98_012188 [Neonectria punicea]|uniref:Nephrocystin 3-like N-terminal domain-containing protein n=1 Tax=Neonectria punicea TaxID=979145 RepID=A0ABR1GJN6_9HYPO